MTDKAHPNLHSGFESELRYVSSGQPHGWAAVAQVVREFDEEKVKDCKEDMDTLLVFAGLFSAVLTAFLIESYQALQEDPSDRMLRVLERIASQTASYTLQSGMLNTTALHPAPVAPFTPSDTDVRINVLWFASLAISLTTASFAILVKQWLRVFLSSHSLSPRTRARTRQLRYPELKRWKVFEFASLLPLLLQLALGLFFLGLCYFTSSTNEKVGSWTTGIVIGWAFCFFSVTLMPCLFPRCPFRTTLLEAVFRATHQCLSVLIPALLCPMWGLVEAQIQKFHSIHVIENSWPKVDLDVLLTADTLQINDDFFCMTIAPAVRQIHPAPAWADTIMFMQGILANRYNRFDVIRGDAFFVVFSELKLSLSLPATGAMVEVLTGLVVPTSSSKENEQAALVAFSILVAARRTITLPDVGVSAMSHALALAPSYISRTFIKDIFKFDRHHTRGSLQQVLYGFADLLEQIDCGLMIGLECFESIMDEYWTQMRIPPHVTRPQQSFTYPTAELWPWGEFMRRDVQTAALRFLLRILVRGLKQKETLASMDETRIGGALRAAFGMFSLFGHTTGRAWDDENDRNVVRRIICQMLDGGNYVEILLRTFMSMPMTWLRNKMSMQALFGVLQDSSDEQTDISVRIAGLIPALAGWQASPYTCAERLQLCYVVVAMSGAFVTRVTVHDDTVKIFAPLASLLNREWDARDKPEVQQLVRDCLQLLEPPAKQRSYWRDTHEVAYVKWREASDSDSVVNISNALVRALGKLYTGRRSEFWRVRWVKELGEHSERVYKDEDRSGAAESPGGLDAVNPMASHISAPVNEPGAAMMVG